MIRILLMGAVMAIILGALGYSRFIAGKNNAANTRTETLAESLPDDATTQPAQVPKSLPATSIDEQVKGLKSEIDALTKQINSLKQDTATDSRLKSLEASLSDLTVKVAALEKGESSTTTASSPAKYPLYIPLGSGGDINSRDWTTLNSFEVVIDPLDYPGYKSVNLEVNMRLNEPKATTAYARLINTTDNKVVSGEASTSSTFFGIVSSGGFNLTTGKKTYKLQAKTADTGQMFVQDARLKVNF